MASIVAYRKDSKSEFCGDILLHSYATGENVSNVILNDLINTLPNDNVQLTVNPNNFTLTVRCGSSSTEIKGIDAQEFPPLPVPDMEGAIQLNVADFKDMISQVVCAASTDEARPVLMGVLLQVDKDKLTMAAADGFRLSVRKATLAAPAPAPLAFLIAPSIRSFGMLTARARSAKSCVDSESPSEGVR